VVNLFCCRIEEECLNTALQVSIFQTLQNNLASIDFNVLLIGVMTIADEVDSQLSQAMESYLVQSL
jgi:hypothetical protein